MRNKNVKPKTYARRRQSMRLKGYDYAQPGMYFVTICVRNKLYLFGDIINNQMQCNDAGNMLWFWFYQIEHQFAGIKCDECMVMPNHIHFIIAITEAQQRCHSIVAHDNQKISLSFIVRWWKTMTTTDYIRGVKRYGWERFDNKLWQRSYWDGIIDNEIFLHEIRKYIKYNPQKWSTDTLNTENKVARG